MHDNNICCSPRAILDAEKCDGSVLLAELHTIFDAAQAAACHDRCMVAPHPELARRMQTEIEALRSRGSDAVGALLRVAEPRRPGFNDGTILPPDSFPLGTPATVIRSAAADRAPLRGAVRVIVVLVDFTDKPMTQSQQHYRDLFFSQGVIPTGSVREYYAEATHGLIDIQGDVVGPFRMPQTLAVYAHGRSGIGGQTPNAATMARDAVNAANASVNFTPFDNDGNGFVDAFIVVHAGSGGEQTGNTGDIWSHKWTLDGGSLAVDNTHIFAYLTVPEDCRIGVCCHELGHLLFGFPDLYDTDNSSEGIGNWCLMAGGSWGGTIAGDTPVHPSAWCKANQGWASVLPVTSNGSLNIPDVKSGNHSVFRLWKNGAPGSEYFLMENRQPTGFDASLPGGGLLIWHIDDSVGTNTDENHYKVALMQADGLRNLEHSGQGRGDPGDPFPGSRHNTTFNQSSTPSSKSHSGQDTCVAVTGISDSAPVMTANVQVKCATKGHAKEIKDVSDHKRVTKEATKDVREKTLRKEVRKELIKEKELRKENREKPFDKPTTDKISAFDKGTDNKLREGRSRELGNRSGPVDAELLQLQARVAALESMMLGLLSDDAAVGVPEPFIDGELRPDLSTGALQEEDDHALLHEQMATGSAAAKRLYDTKGREG